MKLHKDNNRKHRASYFFTNALGVVDCSYNFTTRRCKSKDGSVLEDVPVIVITGVRPDDGLIVETEMWAYAHATKEEIANLPATVSDFWFSIGIADVPKLDDNGLPVHDEHGNTVTEKKEGQAKILGYYNEFGDFIKFSGGKREGYGDKAILVDNVSESEPASADDLADVPAE